MNWGQLNSNSLNLFFPKLAPFEHPVALSGGNLNHVWRTLCAMGPTVVKRAPPYVASVPSIALSRKRLLFEARALKLYQSGPIAQSIVEPARPPKLYGFSRRGWLLAEEDVGTGPDFSESNQGNALGLLTELGKFIGRLHRDTFGSLTLRRRFRNLNVQEVRLSSQYSQIREFARRSGASDADALGRVATALGQRWLRPGQCLIMGDLWPQSILIRPEGIRIIDWEFAHFGSPAQDVSHLVAHLALRHLDLKPFLVAYRDMLGKDFEKIWTPEVHRDAGVHFGSELLARIWGPFRSDQLARADLCMRALDALRNPASCEAFAFLNPEQNERPR